MIIFARWRRAKHDPEVAPLATFVAHLRCAEPTNGLKLHELALQNMANYEFVTIWRVEAPQEKVWDLIFHSENWPDWWPGVEKVERLKDGDANHLGAIHRYTWKSKLPYRLVFEMQSTRVEPISVIEGRAIGELQGAGRWQLSNADGITTVRYDWKVETTKAWMNLLAPVARPFFSWNHNVVMGWGGEGLAKRLGSKLLSNTEVH
jgi:carbon monoxide dehydrogenase subunit G